LPFIIRGIQYQYEGDTLIDGTTSPLAQLEDERACNRDVPYLIKLRINTILIDMIKPATRSDYSACMEQLQKAGIYVLVGLAGINRNIPALQAWDRELQQTFISIVDGFYGYRNVLGFYLTGSPVTVPYVQAAARDLKLFLKSRGRKVPIGYAGLLRGRAFSDRLNCGDGESAIDFMALMTACDEVNQAMDIVTVDHSTYSIPTLLHGFGWDPQTSTNISEFGNWFRRTAIGTLSGRVAFSYFKDQFYNTSGKYFQVIEQYLD
jgi:hypothetical protein